MESRIHERAQTGPPGEPAPDQPVGDAPVGEGSAGVATERASEETRPASGMQAAPAASDAGAVAAAADRAQQDYAVHEVEPLLLASEAYVRMERTALEATRTLHLAFRIFDPRTALRSEAALNKGLQTWADLLEDRAAAGVSVRVLTTDFDPLMAGDLHDLARANADALNRLTLRTGGQIAALSARHPGELGLAWRALLWPLVIRRAYRAGIRRVWPPVHLWPATHHLKVLVADARAMVIGGIDVNERRYDDPSHDRPAEETWQDVSVFVKGAAAATADAFVRWLWDGELKRRGRFRNRASERGIAVPAELIGPLGEGSVRAMEGPAGAGPGDVHFHVTASVRRRSLSARGPSLVSASLIECVVASIAQAHWFIYIENQFIRDRAVGAALAARLRAVPDLQLIIVVPAAPDEVVFASNRSNGQRHGEWRQLRILRDLQREFAGRVGIFTLIGARPPKAREVDRDRAVKDGRGIIYVHSKVLIVDDVLAMVSSANLNGRSLRMDTEAGISWYDPQGVAAFRARLWAKHLPQASPSGADVLSAWQRAAGQPAEDRKRGFASFWDEEKATAFARRRPYIPARYV